MLKDAALSTHTTARKPGMGSLVNNAGRLFGSDVYTHYSDVYAWNSSQMAHDMMGSAGTTLFKHASTRLGRSARGRELFVQGNTNRGACFPRPGQFLATRPTP